MREPLEASGMGRSLYYQIGPDETDVGGILLESLRVGANLLPEYLDISGVTVAVRSLTNTAWSISRGKPSRSTGPYLETANFSECLQRSFSFQGVAVDHRRGF